MEYGERERDRNARFSLFGRRKNRLSEAPRERRPVRVSYRRLSLRTRRTMAVIIGESCHATPDPADDCHFGRAADESGHLFFTVRLTRTAAFSFSIRD